MKHYTFTATQPVPSCFPGTYVVWAESLSAALNDLIKHNEGMFCSAYECTGVAA